MHLNLHKNLCDDKGCITIPVFLVCYLETAGKSERDQTLGFGQYILAKQMEVGTQFPEKGMLADCYPKL